MSASGRHWGRVATATRRQLKGVVLAALVLATASGCGRRAQPPTPSASSSSADAGPAEDAAPTGAACAHARLELLAGLTVERIEADPAAAPAGACITLVRIDPARFRLRILAASKHGDGASRPLPEWVRTYGETGGINTSMYLQSGRSTGILRSAELVDRDADNAAMGAYLAFDPVSPEDAPVALFGRGCPGVELADVRARYRGLVQNYRILGCDGEAVPWQDEKRFSAAAVALDEGGHVVFVHSRTPWQMTAFAQRLADPALGLRAAMYVEGGPEASLYVRAGAGGAAEEIAEVGSFETGFFDASNTRFWAIPNVLSFAPR